MGQFIIDDRKHFEHDCDECVFLGHAFGADLYACELGNTVIVRESDDPADYVSGRPLVSIDARLAAAYGIAIHRGISFNS